MFISQPAEERGALFSPKFGGGPLETGNSERANYDMGNYEESKASPKPAPQETPAFTSVIGNLLTGNPKRPAKRIPKDTKERTKSPDNQNTGMFRFF